MEQLSFLWNILLLVTNHYGVRKFALQVPAVEGGPWISTASNKLVLCLLRLKLIESNNNCDSFKCRRCFSLKLFRSLYRSLSHWPSTKAFEGNCLVGIQQKKQACDSWSCEASLDGAFRNLILRKVSLTMAGCFELEVFKVPSNSNHSMIWLYHYKNIKRHQNK